MKAFNRLKTKFILNCIHIQLAPRGKRSQSRLYKPVS